MLLAGLLLRILAFGMLVVPARALKFNFTDVQQCGPVLTTFSGANISTVPASLSILPLNSTAIVVPLQNPALVSSGISVSPLPLPVGSNFLASLDDATGENLISVSDLIRVLPSGDSSCLPNPNVYAPRRFSIGSTVVQCEDMTINYDTSVVSKAPSVRLYTPRGVSFLLQQKSDNPANGTATYTMNALRGVQIMLLMDDGANIRETSPLLTVAGDASSDKSCFFKQNSTISNATVTNDMNTSGTVALQDAPVISKSVIIGSAIGGVALLFIAIAMVIFVMMDRQKRRKTQGIQFDPSAMEKAWNNEKPGSNAGMPVERSARPPDSVMVVNPIYTTNSFLSIGKSNKGRKSMASWTQVAPQDQKYLVSTAAPPSPVPSSRILVFSPVTPERPDRQSLESLDIEGMLNMATLQSENTVASRKNSDVSILGPIMRMPSVTVPPAPYLRPETSRRQLRNIPSDVPADPTSMAFSGYSVNPFDSHDVVFQEPLKTGDSLRSPGRGLPVSPRDSASNRMRISGVSGRTSSDWYGIAR